MVLHLLSHQPSAISHQPLATTQNLTAARNTTVRGGRIAAGERNCCSVARVPVVGSVNVVAGVSERTCHTHDALVRLSKSTVASSVRLPENLNILPTRTSMRFWKSRRVLPIGSRLIVWLPPIASARLICRV